MSDQHEVGHPWAIESLRQSLATLPPQWRIELLQEVDSTSSELMRRGHQMDHQPTVLIAQHQSAGRGRSGKQWLSGPRQSITLSMACTLVPRDWMGLSLACGVGVVQALESHLPPSLGPTRGLGLKWPNDLWTSDARAPSKVGGLLIETQSLRSLAQESTKASSKARFCVLGVGLNLRTPRFDGVGELSPPAVGLQELGLALTSSTQTHELLASIVLSLARTLGQFEALGFAPFRSEFERLDCLRGRVVHLSDARHGRALGVNDHGELLLEMADGVHTVQASEVSIRPE
jgi:BirA family biotin operon repressor/biotin-[acetyl-CoA-carboxylase] ligase